MYRREGAESPAMAYAVVRLIDTSSRSIGPRAGGRSLVPQNLRMSPGAPGVGRGYWNTCVPVPPGTAVVLLELDRRKKFFDRIEVRNCRLLLIGCVTLGRTLPPSLNFPSVKWVVIISNAAMGVEHSAVLRAGVLKTRWPGQA